MKRIIKKYYRNILYFIYYAAFFAFVSCVFVINDCGSAWELLKENRTTAPNYALLTLILYRITIYSLPALLVFIFKVTIIKVRYKKAVIDSFNMQFISYSIVAALWKLAGMDYYFGADLFNAMDSFILLVGLVLSITAKVSTSKPYEVNVDK